MRLPLDKFLEKLNIGRTLSAYEAQPWFVYDEAKGISASAEVRMGPDGTDLEAEIQFLYDEIPADYDESTAVKPPPAPDALAPEEEADDLPPKYGGMFSDGRQQIMFMRAQPVIPNEWAIKILRIKGKDYVNAFGGWDEKACNFFSACVQAMAMNELPDIDALIEEHMRDEDSWGGGRRGRIGRKAPNIKPAQLMGMKR